MDIPKNGENDVKAGVVKENVELNREFYLWGSWIWLSTVMDWADKVELTKLVAAAAY